MRRRDFLLSAAPCRAGAPGFQLVDVTANAGIDFTHNSGAAGRKWLPETLGSGCAFLDYDNDGWQDILLVNGMDWPAIETPAHHPGPLSQQPQRHLHRCDARCRSRHRMYGLGVAVGDYNNDGFPDLFITAVGQSRLFRNTGKGTFVDVTAKAGLGIARAFPLGALWFDYDRDGLLDLFVANYVRWSPERTSSAASTARRNPIALPKRIRGTTCWLFRNRGDGTFEDVTAKAGLFDSSSKSLGVALLDYDLDGWPDLFVANDTQPNKLYRNNRNGTFTESRRPRRPRLQRGWPRARRHGRRRGRLRQLRPPRHRRHQLRQRNAGPLSRLRQAGVFVDQAPRTHIGRQTRDTLGFGCFFFDVDLDGRLDLLVNNGHIDETIARARPAVHYAQPPHLFLNQGAAGFLDVAAAAGPGFARPRVGRGAAFADFDNDGDLDVLLTTNNGPPVLFRNDQTSGNRSLRLRLIGTRSNRDAVGAVVHYEAGDLSGQRTVKGGSSYLSQSELTLTLGLGKRDKCDQIRILWPSGRTEEYENLKAGLRLYVVEGKGIVP